MGEIEMQVISCWLSI